LIKSKKSKISSKIVKARQPKCYTIIVEVFNKRFQAHEKAIVREVNYCRTTEDRDIILKPEAK
jgi:hypothetical protein